MNERLRSVEKPKNPIFRIIYVLVKKQYGKVLTPLSQIFVRLPLPFLFWNARISQLDKKLKIGGELTLLIRLRVSQLNTCMFCMDFARNIAVNAYKNPDKFFRIHEYESSPLYSNREKAALRFVSELTTQHKISDATYRNARDFFNDRELVELAWVVSSEHVYNIQNIAFNIESDNICRIPQPSETTGTAILHGEVSQ